MLSGAFSCFRNHVSKPSALLNWPGGFLGTISDLPQKRYLLISKLLLSKAFYKPSSRWAPLHTWFFNGILLASVQIRKTEHLPCPRACILLNPTPLFFIVLPVSQFDYYLTSPLFFKQLIGMSLKEAFAAPELNPEHGVPFTWEM